VVGESPVQPGDVVAGKYRVDRILGAGAMGVVVAAMHLDLQEKVALKFMLPAVLGSSEAVERFLREARAAVRLKSQHVCRVLDVGRTPEGAPYIVMEYLEGTDVHELLARRRVLPVPEAADIVRQVCEAMAEAHAIGIVHRDLKPQNLFLTRNARGAELVKVLDFGVSKAASDMSAALATHTQAIMGSPAYMSPEQLRSSKNVDGRADIWSLGTILYQLTTGRLPYTAETLFALAGEIMDDAPVEPPRKHRPDLPAAFEAIVLRALEKDRERRFATVDELASALEPFAAERGARLRRPISSPALPAAAAQAVADTIAPPALGTAETVAPAAVAAVASARAPSPPGTKSTLSGAASEVVSVASPPARRRWPLAVGGGLVAAVAAVIALKVGGGGGGSPAATTPAAAPRLEDQAAAPAPAPAPAPPVEPVAAAPPDAGAAVAATTPPAPPPATPPATTKTKTDRKRTEPKASSTTPTTTAKDTSTTAAKDAGKDATAETKVEPKVEPKPVETPPADDPLSRRNRGKK
jgi:serine/threonine-protein kinase